MKVSKHTATTAKAILTGMVVENTVLGRISERWSEGGLFAIRWANLVGQWCVDYHRTYGKAPRSHIEGLFDAWADQSTDDDTVELVDRFLGGLSEEYEDEAAEINPDYLVDRAGEHFNGVLLERMTSTVSGHIDRGDLPKALDAAGKWNKVEMGVGSGVDVLLDKSAVMEAFENVSDPLIKYPGALGKFFGDQLGRDEFVAIIAATGRGKTWWLLDIAWMGQRQGRKVAFFEVGDMSQNQIMRRFMVRAAAHPIKQPYSVEVPVSISRDGTVEGAAAEVEHITKRFDGPLDPKTAWEACQKKTRRHKTPLLRLSTHPNDSLNVEGISSILDGWEREGWVPDIIVVDYADVLAAPAGYQAGDREAIGATWKQLRSLSQSRHCLVATATQADAGSYTATTVRRGNFSDDRRKNDHVTGIFGINATETEQAANIYRLNWLKRREEAFTESRCVHVAHCLSLGRPHVKSTF